MPSSGSYAAGAFVGEGAGSETSVVVTALPPEQRPLPVTPASRVMLFGAGPGGPSPTVPRTRTRSPTTDASVASDEDALRGRRVRVVDPASSSCTKKPLSPSGPSKSPTTTPSIVCSCAGTGVVAPGPWIVEISVAGSPHAPTGSGGAGQLFVAPA